MFYADDSRGLAVPVTQPLRHYLPDAPLIPWDGQTYVALKHDEPTTLFLRGQGLPVQTPVERYYDWNGTTPLQAQRTTSGEATIHRRMFILNDMGTGKTRAAYYAFDWLRRQGRAKRMLVAAPLSILTDVWMREGMMYFPHLRVQVVHASDAARRRKMLALDADVYVVNHDGLKVLQADLMKRADIDVVCIDELTIFRNYKAEIWKAARDVISGRQYVWGMTGNPTPDSPVDAFGQILLIRPENLHGMRRKAFREATMLRVGPFRWLPRKDSQKIVADMFAPSVRFTRSECLDLPPTVRTTYKAELSKTQKHATKVMIDAMAMDIAGSTVVAANAGVLLSKLVQIGCGVVYDGNGGVITIGAPHREKLLLDILKQFNSSKALVFAPTVAIVRHLAKLLPGFGVIHGAVKPRDRSVIFNAYQHGSLPGIVAEPRCMSHGLTLTKGNLIVWYAPYTRNETVEQANARQARAGQTRTTYIVQIAGSYHEQRIYENNRVKEGWANVLLDVVKHGA